MSYVVQQSLEDEHHSGRTGYARNGELGMYRGELIA
jgi:hypothetical protein